MIEFSCISEHPKNIGSSCEIVLILPVKCRAKCFPRTVFSAQAFTHSAAVHHEPIPEKSNFCSEGRISLQCEETSLGQFSRSLKQKLCSRELIQTVQLTWLHCLLNLSLILVGFLQGCLQAWFTCAGIGEKGDVQVGWYSI